MRDFGPFELQGQIGAGGTGTVHLAIQKSLGRRVVLKIPHLANDPGLIHRFQKEAHAVAQVKHENIVQVIDFGIHEGRPYIALELVEGIDLRQLMDSEPIPTEIGLVMLRDMFLGLEHAHEKKIVHRDIKPSNLMLTGDGLLKILDFGLAQRGKDEGASGGTTTGTPAYMSPEQISGGIIDERSDVFSAGIVAYELLTGRRPFGGRNVASALRSIQTETPPPLRLLNPRVPPGFDDVVHSMLHKEPALRCPSIRVARVESERALLTLGVTSPRDLLREYAVLSVSPGGPGTDESMLMSLSDEGAETVPTGEDAGTPGFKELASVPAGATLSRRLVLEPTPTRKRRTIAIATRLAAAIGLWGLLIWIGSDGPQGVPLWAWALIAALCVCAGFTFLPDRGRRKGYRETPDVSATMVLPAEAHSVERVLGEKSKVAHDLTQEFDLSVIAAVAKVLNESDAVMEDPTTAESLVGRDRMSTTPAEQPTKAPAAALVVTGRSDSVTAGSRFEITDVPFVIGRDPECNICLEYDQRVSRRHAAVTYADQAYWVQDLSSSNGTWLDGRRLTGRMPILVGSTITVGSCTFSFTLADPGEPPNLIGTVVQERFVLQKLMRRTSRSLTFEAEDRRLPKKVVVKVLRPHLFALPQYIESFRREASTAAKLSHPHIARTIDSGTFRSKLGSGQGITLEYYCVEMFDGGSLMGILTRNERPQLDEIARWLGDLADAAAHAHRQGIVHGGIKPSAILLDGDRNAYLTDFAFATRAGETGGSMLHGAPDYLAPEQWNGAPLGPGVDQYALGVLAYALIAGALPFDGQEREDVRRRNLDRGPVAVHVEAERQGRLGVPKSVSAVLTRALAPDPAQRFPSVVEFAAAVRKCTEHPNASPEGPRVFVSYRRDSSGGWANVIASKLKQRHGVEAFVDTLRLDSPGRFPARIQRAIEECDVFLCLLCSNTLESKYVSQEISMAHSRGKPMIPILMESFRPEQYRDSQIPHLEDLLEHDGIHLLDERNIHITYTVDQIARLVRGTIGGEGRPSM